MISMMISVSIDKIFIILHDAIWNDVDKLLQWLLLLLSYDDDDNDDDDDDYSSMKRVYE